MTRACRILLLAALACVLPAARGELHAAPPADRAGVAAARHILERVLGPRAASFDLRLVPAQDSLDLFEVEARGGCVSVRGSSPVALVRVPTITCGMPVAAWCRGAARTSICLVCSPRWRVCACRRRTGSGSISTSVRLGTRPCGGTGRGGSARSTGWRFTVSICPWLWLGRRASGSGSGSLSASRATACGRSLSAPPSSRGNGWETSTATRDPSRRRGSTARSSCRRGFLAGSELGMTPIVPAFSGFVPDTFRRRFPSERVSEHARWSSLPDSDRTFALVPGSSMFQEIGKRFIAEYHRTFGPCSLPGGFVQRA